MTKQKKQLLVWRILLGILIICNIATIFLLSSQNGIKSDEVSHKLIAVFVKIFSPAEEETTTQAPIETTAPKPTVTTPAETTTPDDITTESPEETTPSIPEESSPEENTGEAVTTPEKEPDSKPQKPEKPLTEEQLVIVQTMNSPIRNLAHMLEFGSLAMLCLLFLLTWRGKIWWRYLVSLAGAFLCSLLDEWHQTFVDGRAAEIADIHLDCKGAFIACTLAMLIAVVIRRSRRLVVTEYTLPILFDQKAFDIAVVSDLHGCRHTELVERLREKSPAIILLPGDLTEAEKLTNENADVYAFLRACAAIAPTYYAFGNHETIGARKNKTWCQNGAPVEIREKIEQTGVKLLHNESVLWNGIRICGLSSGLTKTTNVPDEVALAEFAAAKELRILLCHHPEYFESYIRTTNIELTVSGHAHGGHWRFFGHGVLAPGQGILPKYTSGVVDNRLVISRGAGDHTLIPRIANPREVVIIHATQKNQNDNS